MAGASHGFSLIAPSWELHKGPIPEGLCVLHDCDNPPCVNPGHLFLGTKGDNLKDMYSKGRAAGRQRGAMPPGEGNPSAKLTSDQVREMRNLYSAGRNSRRELERIYAMSPAQINKILRWESWAHLTD